MKVEYQKSSDNVLEKRHAVKAQVNNNSGLINWVDFADVREHFSYLNIVFITLLPPKLHNKSLGLHSCKNTTYKTYSTNAPTAINIIFFINYSPNLILQAVLTQAEKDTLSFFACCWINSSSSSSNRMLIRVLLGRSYLYFSFFSCIGAYRVVDY